MFRPQERGPPKREGACIVSGFLCSFSAVSQFVFIRSQEIRGQSTRRVESASKRASSEMSTFVLGRSIPSDVLAVAQRYNPDLNGYDSDSVSYHLQLEELNDEVYKQFETNCKILTKHRPMTDILQI